MSFFDALSIFTKPFPIKMKLFVFQIIITWFNAVQYEPLWFFSAGSLWERLVAG
jgi:hypothetical protein